MYLYNSALNVFAPQKPANTLRTKEYVLISDRSAKRKYIEWIFFYNRNVFFPYNTTPEIQAMNKAYTVVHLALVMVILSLILAIICPTIQQRRMQAEVVQIKESLDAASLNLAKRHKDINSTATQTISNEDLYACLFQDNFFTTPTTRVSDSLSTPPRFLAQCESTAGKSSVTLSGENDFRNTPSQNIRKNNRAINGDHRKIRQAKLRRAVVRAILREQRRYSAQTSATSVQRSESVPAQ